MPFEKLKFPNEAIFSDNLEAKGLGIPGEAVLTGNLPLKGSVILDETLFTGKFTKKHYAIREPRRKLLPVICVCLW